MLSQWRIVGLSPTIPKPPRLHVRFQKTGGGYLVELTDLEYIWKEELSKEDVLKRAAKLETEIDPSQDRKQLDILLTNIENSLYGKTGTKLELFTNDGDITINLSAKLPEPFEPLFWEIDLSRRNQHEFYEAFVYPLLESHYALSREVSSLLIHMGEKDNVIEKLVDGYQNMGFDLGNLFPSLGRKLKGTKGRQIAGSVVKGLGRFDEKQWHDEIENAPASGRGPAFIQSVVERETLKPKIDPHDKESLSEWWKTMPRLETDSKGSRRNMLVSWPDSHPLDFEDHNIRSTQEDFETQEDVKKEQDGQTFSTMSQFETFVETSDKVESNAQTQKDEELFLPATQESQPGSQTRSKGKLGRIGGARPTDNNVQEKPMEKAPVPNPAESTTEIQQAEETFAPSEWQPSESAKEVPIKRNRGKLGKIGGSKESTRPDPIVTNDQDAETVDEAANKRREELKRNIANESKSGKPKKRRL